MCNCGSDMLVFCVIINITVCRNMAHKKSWVEVYVRASLLQQRCGRSRTLSSENVFWTLFGHQTSWFWLCPGLQRLREHLKLPEKMAKVVRLLKMVVLILSHQFELKCVFIKGRVVPCALVNTEPHARLCEQTRVVLKWPRFDWCVELIFIQGFENNTVIKKIDSDSRRLLWLGAASITCADSPSSFTAAHMCADRLRSFLGQHTKRLPQNEK